MFDYVPGHLEAPAPFFDMDTCLAVLVDPFDKTVTQMKLPRSANGKPYLPGGDIIERIVLLADEIEGMLGVKVQKRWRIVSDVDISPWQNGAPILRAVRVDSPGNRMKCLPGFACDDGQVVRGRAILTKQFYPKDAEPYVGDLTEEEVGDVQWIQPVKGALTCVRCRTAKGRRWCNKCKAALYCSVACQKEDEQRHAPACTCIAL